MYYVLYKVVQILQQILSGHLATVLNFQLVFQKLDHLTYNKILRKNQNEVIRFTEGRNFQDICQITHENRNANFHFGQSSTVGQTIVPSSKVKIKCMSTPISPKRAKPKHDYSRLKICFISMIMSLNHRHLK